MKYKTKLLRRHKTKLRCCSFVQMPYGGKKVLRIVAISLIAKDEGESELEAKYLTLEAAFRETSAKLFK